MHLMRGSGWGVSISVRKQCRPQAFLSMVSNGVVMGMIRAVLDGKIPVLSFFFKYCFFERRKVLKGSFHFNWSINQGPGSLGDGIFSVKDHI